MVLNDEDLRVIRAYGLPVAPDLRYVAVADDGSVTFTLRGRQLYRVALLMYGLDADRVDAVRTRDDLRAITVALCELGVRMAATEAREMLRKDEVPVLSRGMLEATLDGSIAEFADTVKHTAWCAAAGENVMPFPLRRRWPRRAVAASELTPEMLEAIRTAEMPPGYEHFDAELEGWNPDKKE